MASSHNSWWAEKLSSPTVTPLTRDYPDSSQESIGRRPIEALEVLSAQSSGLAKLAETYNSDVVLLTTLFAIVARLTGDEDVSLGTNLGLDGPPVVLRITLAPSDPFDQLYSKVQDAISEAKAHPLDLEEVKKQTGASIFYRFAAFNSSSLGTSTYAFVDSVDFLLDYTCNKNGSLQLTTRYNQRLFSSARISGILAQVAQFLDNAAQDPKLPIGSIEFITKQQKALLPNPTSDLGWSSFRGAIHDIFAANAERHPDRLCVVETSHEESPERKFTYQQIHHASNVLAHHLVDSGLERGDVVMIYSYRGVDLVVAVMGTLKAGGTFSVLDPAYPPDRQNIYLEVSKPRALLVIDKATQEAGPLDAKVRAFIKHNLDLKTEVPALRLHDDGNVTGGSVSGKDILEDAQLRKSQNPGVVVGPDSTPTLSFTSGSEGRPKGVQGRHYSLAYYFDWMAKTFKLSENDKFTMLSGIAHDPIQRDMFTPLFLGAQLLVPARDDIQNERLAEWMRDHGATVTHLTPAMGQILVGGATATFDTLHHAFFVGDILIKRDCRSLQNLAPNVAIVNMYGTTETQRAVSYYEIPSRNDREGFLDGMKDVIPAGRGMYNVQLLVVNRFDRTKTCAIGEIGEIYVRAGGLAEGYLGTPELTKTKFVENWFPGHESGLETDAKRFEELKSQPWAQYYRGARDRLYRSGDLGRYTPSGDVECSGRADDQVKIRGFRIELGEIDTHLSQHPLVRENVTLVRRDKFEEQTLVSYVRPQMNAWEAFLSERGLQDESDSWALPDRMERFRLLQAHLQEYLRTKLPAYAVPTMIIPMRAMPLNPNGKIDKPKLPFPDADSISMSRRRKSSMRQPLTPGEMQLAQLWAGLIPGLIAKTIKPSESFSAIGGDSMKIQRLAYQIRKTLGVSVPTIELIRNSSLKDMATVINRRTAVDALDGYSGDDDKQDGKPEPKIEYGSDAEAMAKDLPQTFTPSQGIFPNSPTVFLTGATGFLGCFILRDLLTRKEPEVRKVYTLVRAKDAANALERLKTTCQAYGVWKNDWANRIECLVGNLGPSKFGLEETQWKTLTENVDAVIHNGAQVHWLNTYEMLKDANVLGTVEAIRLCAEGKPKLFSFVSSTSVLDKQELVNKSLAAIAAGGEGLSEDDELLESKTGLGTGYGQSKWVAEYLARESGRRGLRGCVVRPGYVLGDSKTGVTNTDDFLIRLLKGCIQLGSRPNMNNTVNMVPVDHVARTVVACTFHPSSAAQTINGGTAEGGVSVAQITSHPRLRFNQYLSSLSTYGYTAQLSDYIPWTSHLESYVSSHSDFALMPLYTFVNQDLPTNTQAPDLDDRNAETSLYKDAEWTGEDVSGGTGVTKGTVGLYLAYLVAVGFIPAPGEGEESGKVTVNGNGSGSARGHQRVGSLSSAVKVLPRVNVSVGQKAALAKVGGRGGTA